MGTGVAPPQLPPEILNFYIYIHIYVLSKLYTGINGKSSPRLISTGQLNMLPHLHLRPIYLIIYHESYLVTTSGIPCLEASFTLRCFQRLSSTHIATQLYAPGGTTDTPAVCPSRSSRTKDSSSQVSCACDG